MMVHIKLMLKIDKNQFYMHEQVQTSKTALNFFNLGRPKAKTYRSNLDFQVFGRFQKT